MQCDDLVPKDVVARGDVCRDLHEPGACVGDEHVRGPEARVGPVDPADIVNLEELEGGLVYRLAVAVAVGEVVQDGPVVRVRPDDGPLDGDRVTRVHGRVATGWGGVLVADDVACLIGVRGDEAVVCVAGGPAYHDRRVGFVWVGSWIIALPVDTVDDEVVDMAMSNGSTRYDQTTEQSACDNSHRVDFCRGRLKCRRELRDQVYGGGREVEIEIS